ncbi:MAG: 1-acyl-sn-glycerol-3-phosphate acyltransferase [Deltaproteobacteria bacterium]|nr:1-acyl-sn-glycerol-3-phosphate acyltransferase [Deltaproteobacteria bacterium]
MKRTKIQIFFDWLLYLLFVLLMLIILLLFDPLQRLAIRISRNLHARVIYLLNFCLVFNLKTLGAEIKINKTTHANPSLPTIVISNHQSMFDVCAMYLVFPEKLPRFIAKKELSRWIPSVSYNLRHGHNAVIDRKDRRQSIKAISSFAKLVNENKYCAVIFPEGTRARSGKLKEFHAAGLGALLKYIPEAEIFPVAVDGSWKFNRYGSSPTQTFSSVTITVGERILKNKDSDPEQISSDCFNFIKQHLT